MSQNRQNKDPYGDILHLPHHRSPKRTPMPILNRAAQFAPFSGLTGYEGLIRETARLTDERKELDEDAKAPLNERLLLIAGHLDECHEVSITYYLPDERKEGGAYIVVKGNVRRIDEHAHVVRMRSGAVIPIDEIVAIEGELFHNMAENA